VEILTNQLHVASTAVRVPNGFSFLTTWVITIPQRPASRGQKEETAGVDQPESRPTSQRTDEQGN
jgi:hypothetical protein